MLLPHKQQLIVSTSLLLMLFVYMFMVEIAGAYPSYILSTFIIIASGIYLAISCSVFSVQLICFIIIFFPALSPMYAWDIKGAELFSYAAPLLQEDLALVGKTVFLFAIAAVGYVAIASLRLPKGDENVKLQAKVFGDLPDWILIVIAILTLVAGFVLEPGPTLFTANYAGVMAGRSDSTLFNVAIQTVFGGLWAILFLFGRHRKILFWGVTIIIVSWLLLHSRRVELFGIFLVLILWGRYHLNRNLLILIAVGFICVQIFVGIARDHPLKEYEKISVELSSKDEIKVALPGGASNVFLAGLHLINQKDSGMLTNKQQFSMIEWIRSPVPNQIWQLAGLPKVQTEHDLIFNEMRLQYVGGMHLLAAFYLNGGVVLVLVYGLFHGWLARFVEQVINKNSFHCLQYGKKWTIYWATIFLVYQFRYQWYNPQTLFRAIAFCIPIFLLLTIYFQSRRWCFRIK